MCVDRRAARSNADAAWSQSRAGTVSGLRRAHGTFGTIALRPVPLPLTMPSLLAYRTLFDLSSSLVIVPSGKMSSHNGVRPSFARLSRLAASSPSALGPAPFAGFPLPSTTPFGAASSDDRALRPRRVRERVRLARSAAHDRLRKMKRKNCCAVVSVVIDDHSGMNTR